MGREFIDRFSLLHFATGIVAQYWGTPLWLFILGHVAFQIFEVRLRMIGFQIQKIVDARQRRVAEAWIVGRQFCIKGQLKSPPNPGA